MSADPLPSAYVDALDELGRAAGLTQVGVTSAEPLDRARRVIDERKAAGLHGSMQFTYRNPARSTEPTRLVPSARSIVVGALAYATGDEAGRSGAGRVAWYAAADHYARLGAALRVVADRLVDDGWKARVVFDDNALVDREVAWRAGLGWFGKNANLLLAGRGSWFVLGSVVTDAPLPVADRPVPDGCGACTRCLDRCPTGAIVGPGVVDARRCLAWLVQAEGSFPEEHREALGDRIYGCDDCQLVCPVNLRHAKPSAAEEREPPDAEPDGRWVDLVDLLAQTDDELLARHGRWYIPRREPRYLRRNALVALGNVGDPAAPAVAATVRAYVEHPDPLLREHAAWAARRLGLGSVVAGAGGGAR
jgi:epoxyqueuosine reductase